MRFDRSTFLAIAGAAVFVCACGPSDSARNDNTSKATPPAGTAGATGTAAATEANANKPEVVLTGCLQEEKGMLGNYILTQANRTAPDQAVGTSGEPKGAVEQRQLDQAAKSYRLSGDSDQLKGEVGHQIRVRGNLVDKSDLKNSDNDVSQGDLAKVDVESVETIANSCNAKK